MTALSYPITSREYKLILNIDRFKNREEGSEAFCKIVEYLLKQQEGKIDKQKNQEEHRKTWYIDTNTLALREQGFILRLREEDDDDDENIKKYKVTLKYRSGDRYLAAAQNLASSSQESDFKFEEDIMPPFTSKFSHSCSIKTKNEPIFQTMGDAINLFPGLGNFEIPEDTPIKIVGNFKAHEIFRKAGKIKFSHQETEIKACFSFWYLLEEDIIPPLIGEFSFDYDAPDGKPEEFSTEVVANTNRFFTTLQRYAAGWLNFDTTTKTAFAYD
jgi:uncharacterized protein YjbK